MVEQIKTTPIKQQEQDTPTMLKSHIQQQGSSNTTVTLSTKGSKARVNLNPSLKTSEVNFSHNALNILQLYLNNISDKHMKNIAKLLHVHGGRNCVEPGYSNEFIRVVMIYPSLRPINLKTKRV